MDTTIEKLTLKTTLKLGDGTIVPAKVPQTFPLHPELLREAERRPQLFSVIQRAQPAAPPEDLGDPVPEKKAKTAPKKAAAKKAPAKTRKALAKKKKE